MDECNAANEYKFEAFRNRNCFSRPDEGYAFRYRYPEIVYYYNSTECLDGVYSESETEELPTGCWSNDSPGYYYFGALTEGSNKYQLISATTTRSPTHPPTFAPTYRPDYYTMSVEQV